MIRLITEPYCDQESRRCCNGCHSAGRFRATRGADLGVARCRHVGKQVMLDLMAQVTAENVKPASAFEVA